MQPFEQQSTKIEKPAGDQHASGTDSLRADYLKSVTSLAKKIENGQLSSDDTRNAVSLTFHNIYESAGGGAAGKQAEDRLQNDLNAQLKADGSQAHMDKVTGSLFGHSENTHYAISDDSRGPGGSGIITPEAAPESSRPGDKAPTSGESGDRVPEAKPAAEAQLKLSETPAYNRAGEDAALAIMSKSLSPEQKAEAILNAMNKAGVKGSNDAASFDDVLNKKLGKVGEVSGSWTQSMFSANFKGALKIKTTAGETLNVPFVTENGKLVAPPKDYQ